MQSGNKRPLVHPENYLRTFEDLENHLENDPENDRENVLENAFMRYHKLTVLSQLDDGPPLVQVYQYKNCRRLWSTLAFHIYRYWYSYMYTPHAHVVL